MEKLEMLCADGKARFFMMERGLGVERQWFIRYYVIKNGKPFGGGAKLFNTKPKWASDEDWSEIQKFYNNSIKKHDEKTQEGK